jgi:hypothetical protein
VLGEARQMGAGSVRIFSHSHHGFSCSRHRLSNRFNAFWCSKGGKKPFETVSEIPFCSPNHRAKEPV